MVSTFITRCGIGHNRKENAKRYIFFYSDTFFLSGHVKWTILGKKKVKWIYFTVACNRGEGIHEAMKMLLFWLQTVESTNPTSAVCECRR